MSRRALPLGLFLALTVTATASPVVADPRSKKAHVEALETKLDGQHLEVSYRVVNAFSPELVEKVQAGIAITFKHRVEVSFRRLAGLWPSRTVASARVDTTARYDSLTHRYELSRVTESSSRGSAPTENRQQNRSTVSAEEMEAWMTEVTMIPALDLSALPEGTTARVHVESTLGRHWILLVPTKRSVSKERKLER